MNDQTKLDAITALDNPLVDDALNARAEGFAHRAQKRRRIWLCAACFALALAVGIPVFLSVPRYPAPLSAEEVQALREENSYENAEINPFVSMSDMKDFSRALNDEDFAAVVTVTVTGEWNERRVIGGICGDEKFPTNSTGGYLPVHVDSVLCSTEAFQNEGDLVLSFRSKDTVTRSKKYFQKGKRYVVFLSVSKTYGSFELPPHIYQTDSLCSYYLTDSNVIIPVNDFFTAVRQYSGWNVNAFGQELRRILK